MFRYLENLVDPYCDYEQVDRPPTKLWPFLNEYARPFRKLFAITAVMSVIVAAVEIWLIAYVGRLVDLLAGSSAEMFWDDHGTEMILIALFLLFLRPVIQMIDVGLLNNAILPNLGTLIRWRSHSHVLRQSVGWFENDFAGRIANRIMQTARAVTDVAGETINVVFFALASLIGSALLLTTINGWMALTLGLWVIGYLLMIRWFMPRIRVRSKARAGARAMVTGQVVDTVTNIKTVKLFAHADHEEHEALDAIGTFRERVLDYGVIAAAFRFCLMAVAGMVPVMLIGGTLWFWSIGVASAGDIAAAGAISIRIAQMSGWVSHTLMAIYGNIGEAEDGMNTLTPPHALVDANHATALKLARPSIDFDGVTFAYGRDAGGIENITLQIAPGEKIGIVGASGAGKSTLVKLLLRLHDPESGDLLANGRSARTTRLSDWYSRVGYVPQDVSTFNGTVAENIAFFRPGVTRDQLVRAAQRAHLHDEIMAFPNGYDTPVGERLGRLSGGQRQRLALARALVGDPDVLVLDEPTSALDMQSETLVQETIDELRGTLTLFVIAHRISTLSSCEKIVVLENGRVTALDSPDRVRETNDFFREATRLARL